MYVPNIYSMEKVIKYGEFTCRVTQRLNGLDDPIVHLVLGNIGTLNWEGYKLYAHGSILNDSPANDIDLTITGPQDPQRVNYLLKESFRIGSEFNVEVDIKYLLSGELFDYKTHKPGETHTCMYAHYQPKIQIDGTLYQYGRKFNGYWISERTWPMTKSHLSTESPVQIMWT